MGRRDGKKKVLWARIGDKNQAMLHELGGARLIPDIAIDKSRNNSWLTDWLLLTVTVNGGQTRRMAQVKNAFHSRQQGD